MPKTYFHNSNLTNENIDIKKTQTSQYLDPNRVVDINKLLNRVKLEKKKEFKQKIFYFSSIIISIGFVGFLIILAKV